MQSCTSLICHYDYLHYFKNGKKSLVVEKFELMSRLIGLTMGKNETETVMTRDR